ncbi:MAG TPA: glutamate--cysteine ligase [Gammaproteobacteria bacterium]|nr:glutamate--cysteine ligase [Gammaproteobacteria bacterium]
MNDLQLPHLNTTLIEPLHFLERRFLSRRQEINDWFVQQWQLTAPPVYGSVDLRNAGFKLAPIDMNLFPAGFNNLNPAFLAMTVLAAQKAILQIMPTAKNILLLPEGHTRNTFYWENVHILQNILVEAGFQVRIGTLAAENTAQTITLSSGDEMQLSALLREGTQLKLADFLPDVILLNNDLSEGIPALLQGLTQPVAPPPELGWSRRLKSEHFHYYQQVAKAFAAHMEVDPWLISSLFRNCGQVDFMQQEGIDCLTHHATILFEEIKQKYQEYAIPYEPFLIVKADAGTYGMAVMTVRHVEELTSLNRKQRTRMATTKGGQPVHQVIIQEGVYTFETVDAGNSVAEPVIYMWGEKVVGGFYRVHHERGIDESLNAPGMQFQPLPFSQACDNPCDEMEPDACPNRFYVYGIVAQLSMLAAAHEMRDTDKIRN